MKLIIMSLMVVFSLVGCSNDDTLQPWPDGICYYTIDDSFNDIEKEIIKESINIINNTTNFSFVEYWDYDIRIVKSKENSSKIGYKPYRYDVNLQSISQHSIFHELGHTIGLIHEHQRIDRNNYIYIFLENIKSTEKHNYKIRLGLLDYTKFEYDYGSTMHYGSFSFSKNLNPTIFKKNGKEVCLKGFTFTSDDIKKINTIYKL